MRQNLTESRGEIDESSTRVENTFNLKIHTKTYTQIFIDNSIIIAETWKQSRCLLVSEWINCDIPRQ